jgi:hypothetical protein
MKLHRLMALVGAPVALALRPFGHFTGARSVPYRDVPQLGRLSWSQALYVTPTLREWLPLSYPAGRDATNYARCSSRKNELALERVLADT